MKKNRLFNSVINHRLRKITEKYKRNHELPMKIKRIKIETLSYKDGEGVWWRERG